MNLMEEKAGQGRVQMCKVLSLVVERVGQGRLGGVQMCRVLSLVVERVGQGRLGGVQMCRC